MGAAHQKPKAAANHAPIRASALGQRLCQRAGMKTRKRIPSTNAAPTSIYGTPTPLKGAAQISTPDAGTIQIKPFDISQVKAISGAISAANIGMTPKDDGKIITLKLPMMTQETRQKLAKQVKDMAEQAKIPIKNARHEAMKQGDASLKESTVTEDQHRKLKDDIQKLTDKYNKQIEENLKKKTDEVMKA